MLALVKTPHIELSLHGEHVEELLAWIRRRYSDAMAGRLAGVLGVREEDVICGKRADVSEE